MHFIIDGDIRIFYRSKANTIAYRANGDDIGDFGIPGCSTHFSYTCDTDVLAMFVSPADLNKILDKHYIDRQFLLRRATLRTRKMINFRTRQEIVRRRFYELQDKNPEMLKALAQKSNEQTTNSDIVGGSMRSLFGGKTKKIFSKSTKCFNHEELFLEDTTRQIKQDNHICFLN